MNILHTETLKRWGGQQNRVLSEIIGLKQRGHNASLACNKGSVLAKKSLDAGVRVYELNMEKKFHFANVPRLLNIINREKIDIVSTHSSVDSWAGAIAAKLAGTRLIRFRHNLFPVGRDPLTRLIYWLPEKIVVISESVKNVLNQRGVSQNKITVIPSSVDVEKFDPGVEDIKGELKTKGNSVVIGNTSTFSRTKGQQYLFRAFNIIASEHESYLMFAGKTSDHTMQKYLPEIKSALRENIIFLGQREDVPAVLKSLDIFVYPSVIEGLGTALLEAMAMERPVAVSDIPTFREFIQDGVNGIFFKPEDHHDLAEKVVHLIKDEGLRKRLGKNARETVLNNFSFHRMIDMTETLYKSILNSE